jgi:hypothetical protein
MSRSGVYHEAAGEHQDMIDAQQERGSHDPGTYGGAFQNRLDSGAVFTIPESAFICWRSYQIRNSYSFIALILIDISISHGWKSEPSWK